MYGIIDAATMYNTNQTATGGSKITVDAGQLLTSRWGFKGSEDLGGGMKAIFNLEGTLANDTGASGAGFGGTGAQSFTQAGSGTSLFDRLAWVGLSGILVQSPLVGSPTAHREAETAKAHRG